MGGLESKSVTGNCTPTSHRKLLVDPRSPTTGIDRTPIAVEKSMGETLRVCETDLNVTPTDEHFLEDPRSPNCPRTPIPLNDPRSPCGAVTRTPIFVKPPSGQESDDKADPEKFVFTIKQTPSPPKIVTTEYTSEMEQSTGQAASTSKATVHSKIEDVTECLKQISTPEYDEELTTLVRSNMKNDVIYRDQHTDTKELPKKPKSNRPSLKKIQKKKIQEMSQGQQRSPLATRNHHSDSPVVSSKTRTYIRLDRNTSDFRKRQNSLGSTGTRLSAKFEIFTEKENV
ncbi:cell division cycle-associated protein 3-like isoform X2 [Anneissia japonica]|nr:cell division cycle-associated protein 3-like isoform X2 [Anneissia japonica]